MFSDVGRNLWGCVLALCAVPSLSWATPQMARQYGVDCSHCHVAPPRLNARGLTFLSAGYRADELGLVSSRSTIPLAIWNTFDVERRHSAELTKGFPSRVELISFGSKGRLSYFAEWRALSQSVGGNRRLLDRSGRFEDLFVRIPLDNGNRFAMTAGQFRGLTQVDVSLRLSLSEPLAFSSSLPAVVRSPRARLTSLRAFSPSGRQPGIRVEYQRTRPGAADGWYSSVTLPVTGELTVPLTDAASFEIEARPKGVFAETYRRWGLNSLGGHVFLGDRRRLASAVVTHELGRFALLGTVGVFTSPGTTDTRFSFGGEYTVASAFIGGVRLDDRTAPGQRPALLLYGNAHAPFGPPAFRQALRLQVEQRVQRLNHVTSIALSHIF